jgi:S1-C subfamily serine protease
MESAIKNPSHGAEVSAVRRGAPWWIWVVAASFALHFTLVNYLDFAGPSLGILPRFKLGGLLVTKVHPRSPADSAGLQPGDRIRRVDGLFIGSYWDWAPLLFNLKVGEPRTFEIQRRNETVTLSVVPKPRWPVG